MLFLNRLDAFDVDSRESSFQLRFWTMFEIADLYLRQVEMYLELF